MEHFDVSYLLANKLDRVLSSDDFDFDLNIDLDFDFDIDFDLE